MASQISKGKKLWQGAVYLSLAALFIKILSALYRVPYQNIAGDVGFYVYQQIYPIYGVAITLSTYGFPVIISKLISERHGQEQKILATAFWSLFIISSVAFIIFFFNAPILATIMGDENLIIPLKAVSFIFFIIPLLSVLRGFFQGHEDMLPTAVSQVTEQFIRVGSILLLTYVFIINGYGPYAAGTGAAIGSVIGGLFGFIVLYGYYRKNRSNTYQKGKVYLSGDLLKQILVQGILLCFSSLILILFQMVDALTILRLLLESGVSLDAARVAKGVYDRGQPLIQMGTVITTSFSLIVVPLIAKVMLDGRIDLVQKYSSLAYRISFLIGGAASIGLFIIIEPTNIMLFTNKSDSIVIGVMGVSIFFTAIFLTTSAILHGLNKIHLTAIHVLVGVVMKLIGNILLVPVVGTIGAAIATVIACAFCAGLNIYRLRQDAILPTFRFTVVKKLLVTFLVLAIATYSWKNGLEFFINDAHLHNRLINTVIALSSVFVGALLFLISIIKGRIFSEVELENIPKFRRLAEIINNRRSE